MLQDLPALRRACVENEAALLAIFSEIAERFVPPFPPKTRAAIAAQLARARQPMLALQRAHGFVLQTPEMRALPMHAPERGYFNAVQRHLRLYPEALARLTAALRQPAVPLFPALPPPHSAAAQMLALHARLWDAMHAHLAPLPREFQDAAGHYPDIPLPTTDFLRLVSAARRVALAMGQTNTRFLDIGCGNGLKILQAAEYFTRSDGLEYEAERANAARNLMQRAGWPHAQIIHADALAYDGYGQYDVLYAYKPMHDAGLQQLEAHLSAQARPGTLFIAPYFDFTQRHQALGWQRLEHYLYIFRPPMPLPPLLRRARKVGVSLPARPKTGYVEDGFLAPLHQALRHWGHGD